jgi:acetone carboxylase gamma subunit
LQDEPGAWRPHERSTPPPILKPQTTHKLVFDNANVRNRRWRCACGYTLGDGREQFLARCPLTQQKKGKADGRHKTISK